MRLLLVLLIIAGLAPRLAAQASSPASVWVNLSSHVYHCPGTKYYGKTKRGEYLRESDARERGFRPAGGRSCGLIAPSEGPRSLLSAGPVGAPGTDAGPPMPDSTSLQSCTISRLVDGDTLECENRGRVRLIGMDSPEDDQPPFGGAATAALASLLPAGASVWLELDQEQRDVYHRLLAYVWFDGAMVNWEMVRRGWAVGLEFPPNLRYVAQFRLAEVRAQAESRGLWRLGGFACRPQDHRRHRC